MKNDSAAVLQGCVGGFLTARHVAFMFVQHSSVCKRPTVVKERSLTCDVAARTTKYIAVNNVNIVPVLPVSA